MKRQQYEKIKKQIEISKTHIENFILESTTGTKRMQSKFHKNAIIERNNFVNKELEFFQKHKENVYNELKENKNNLLPTNNKEEYNREKIKQEVIKNLILLTNDEIPVAMKLGLTKILEPFEKPDDSSLTLINSSLKEFINKLKDANVNLSNNDFNYSMYTSVYMDSFLESIKSSNFEQVMQKNFESIYWECPELVTHLKLNLYSILDKYQKQLKERSEFLKTSLLKKEKLSSQDVYKSYSEKKFLLSNKINTDAYLNLEKFLTKKLIISDYLENSPTREKNFNQFTQNGNYNTLDNQNKMSFIRESYNLYNTLRELKNYYLFEPIIKDLKTIYQKRNETKNIYLEKQKEISKEEQQRIKIYKDYSKSLATGLFSKPNPEKSRLLKLQMNEQIAKLDTLYDELHNAKIYNQVAKLTDASTIFELLKSSLSSYYYLKRVMNENFQEKENYSLDKYLDKYFKFIYQPTNIFIKKINVFTDYDISDIIAEKYRLSGLNISKEMVIKDNLDLTTETIKYVTTVNYINQGNLPLKDMYFIYNVTQLETVSDE